MLSLFVSNLTEEDEVFRFANSYPQPALILCVAPFIAFILDKFTFFPSSPLPMIGADAAALVELLPHLCSYQESTTSSEGFTKVILSIILRGASQFSSSSSTTGSPRSCTPPDSHCLKASGSLARSAATSSPIRNKAAKCPITQNRYERQNLIYNKI